MSRHTIETAQVTFIPALLIIAWTWLLHFPWAWVLYTVIVIQLMVAFIVFAVEMDAARVDGAAGWVACFSFFLQFGFVVAITLIRIVVGVFQLLSLFI